MAKYIPLEGSYDSAVQYFYRLDSQRMQALTCAARGEYREAIALFRRVFLEMPSMPPSWRSHQEVLRELCSKMENHIHAFTEQTLRSLHIQLSKLMEHESSEERQRRCSALLQQHAYDVGFIGNTMSKLTYLATFTDHMCKNGISDARLQQLEILFREPVDIPILQTG